MGHSTTVRQKTPDELALGAPCLAAGYGRSAWSFPHATREAYPPYHPTIPSSRAPGNPAGYQMLRSEWGQLVPKGWEFRCAGRVRENRTAVANGVGILGFSLGPQY